MLIADAQALTENADDPKRVTRHVIDLARDDPAVASIRASPRSTIRRPCQHCTPTPTICASLILGGQGVMWCSRPRRVRS
ncbi:MULTISPECIES: hypothetical protein [Methylobacteriaceae]|uniref:hypothetical protein n=1 Tax=Methylobacteriaceae TaxID=119045 RepID=UPI000AEDE3EC|nr:MULTISPECIES: hypothetical protein [Methylobacteriaceae]